MASEKYYVCFDSPDYYPNRWQFYHEGGSPKILEFLKEYISNRMDLIKEINICLYLFNNNELHRLLKKSAAEGISVNVISIPLEGYDKTKPGQIINKDTNMPTYNNKKSKYDLAVPIYRDLIENCDNNYSLYIFPHMYIRSYKTNPFSRGDLPYSLHAKSILIKFKDGDCALGLTSSNLAIRDIVKDENILIIEGKRSYDESSNIFFSDLIAQSIHIKEFDEKKDWKQFKIDAVTQPKNLDNYFIAPFYKESPFLAEDLLKREIVKAKERIYISGQHISAYKFEFPSDYNLNNPRRYKYKDGFLEEVINKASQGVKVACLSQTFIDPNGSTKFVTKEGRQVNTRRPANISKFREFVKELKKYDNAFYMINDCVHSKYLLVDDTLILTTCNFTPTQFIYIDNVDLRDLGYKGVFSEIGQYIIVRNKAIVDQYSEHFRDYWNHKNTIRYK